MTLVSRITPQQKKEMIKLRKSKMSLREIGKKYNIHSSYVYRLTGGNWGLKTQSVYERRDNKIGGGIVKCVECGGLMANDKWRLSTQDNKCFMCWWHSQKKRNVV